MYFVFDIQVLDLRKFVETIVPMVILEDGLKIPNVVQSLERCKVLKRKSIKCKYNTICNLVVFDPIKSSALKIIFNKNSNSIILYFVDLIRD